MATVWSDAWLEGHALTARAKQALVVLPEVEDERILRAALVLVAQGLARPLLLGDAVLIESSLQDLGGSLDGMVIRDPARDTSLTDLARNLAARRPGMTESLALRLLRKPLYFGSMLVATGAASAMVAGVAHPTRRIIEAALMTIGLTEAVPAASSAMVMQMAGRDPLLFADCAVNADPSPDELAGIAIASAATAGRLFRQPARIAMLSFSTHGSAQHSRIDKVRQALGHVRQRRPDLVVDGELQADAALSPAIAARKIKQPAGVMGDANVLIFPDLDAGNIGYKLVQQIAGAAAYGPLLQGFRQPVCDLSRGATVDEIIASTILTLA